MPSVIFLGTPQFAVPSLSALIADNDFDVRLVITQPDRPVGRKQIVTPPPVKVLAEEHGIYVWQPEKINKEWNNLPDVGTVDFLITVAYGQILSQEILDYPSVAPVNVHASLLPRWRGASPLQHSILAGDKETGITIQRMVKELDAGDIYAQQSTPLDTRETTSSLHDRLSHMGAMLLTDTLKKPLRPTPQDVSQITTCGKLGREDGQADALHMTAEEIDRRVRALVPWPGVQMNINGEQLKILQTELQPSNESIAVPCSNQTTLYVVRLQAPGGTPMTGAEWQRGRK